MSAADFDFFHGSWHIEHRRLKSWLTGCTEWEEFGSDTESRPILGGAGNIDEGFMPSRGYHHATIRLYEPDTDEWALYWITSAGGSVIEPPVRGRFSGGTGLFYAPTRMTAPPVRVPVQVVGHHAGIGALGAGVLDRRRPDVGDQLDHGVDPALTGSGRVPGASHQPGQPRVPSVS